MKGNKEGFNKYKVKRPSRESIEAEEIFLDSKKIKESPESEREKIEFPIRQGGIYFIYILIVILLASLFIRAINLQVVKGEYWQSLAEENRLRSYPIKPLRGIIYDRNGDVLANNQPQYALKVIPADLVKQKQKFSEILEYLPKYVQKSKQEIEEIINRHANLSVPIAIDEHISKQTALILESKFSENPAILVEAVGQREYIDGKYFSHITGYLGKISKPEYKQSSGYFLDDWIGKTGLEYEYEDALRGVPGEKLVEVDSQGEIKNIFTKTESSSGQAIHLSIDSDLQKKLYQELNSMLRRLNTDRAAGIVLNPNNGEILALVSFPSFDNNQFIQGLSSKEFQQISHDPDKPLFNRVIKGTYAPGSTVKPIVAVGAVTEKIIDPAKIINCQGLIRVENKYYPELFRIYHDWKVHGPTNLVKAIAESCNVYFYTIGGGYGDIQGLGIEGLNKYLTKFGLGQLSGIDLPGEAKGLIPNAQWKQEYKGEKWYLGDTYNVSIGQGDVMVTPLQIALATSAIANQGILFKPQVVHKIDNQTISPEVAKQDLVEEQIVSIVAQGMREAVISGSAQLLYSLPVKVAGKTGTAQAPNNPVPHGWFTGFAPYENPEIVITILIENGGEGSAVAVPVAKQVLQWYFSK